MPLIKNTMKAPNLLKSVRFSLLSRRECRFSSGPEDGKVPSEKGFVPGESVYDLSVAQKYILGNIKSIFCESASLKFPSR